MAKGRWKLTDEQLASEAYAVLIGRQKAGRSLGRSQLKSALKYPGIYKDFLKHCLEQDRSKDLRQFKKGLKLVVTSIGVTQLSEATGLSRLSLYRMLSKDGNPRFGSLMALFRALEIHFWIVDDDFMASVQKVIRPKDITPESLPTKTYRDLGL
ncbi:MAG: hypothetical protein KDD22_01550, partial [Bdellovibrionales bacterium]|nr:hypothetical protein [Bdellovibrionales bacterium]